MPHLFAGMCEALTGEHTDVTMLAFSNRTLAWHCEEYFSVRFALLYGAYDYCVIQQFGHPIPPIEETEPPLEKLIRLCESVGTRPVLYMTWAKKDEPKAVTYRAAASNPAAKGSASTAKEPQSSEVPTIQDPGEQYHAKNRN